MTERDKIVGDIFRNNLYSWNNIPAIAENIGKNIAKEFDYSDFLMQSLATQLIIAANINPIIKDLLAVRIIILNETNLTTLKKCYQIFFKIISSLTQLNNRYLDFPLIVSEPDKLITNSAFKQEEFPDILVPEIKFPDNFERVVKDYMKYPKQNGYQSLHCSFEIPSLSPKYAGLNMEIQLRTLQQHEWAEYMNASHSKYKRARSEKMDKIFYFDPKKVHMAGYSELSDFCGLCKPIQLCQRHKTF